MFILLEKEMKYLYYKQHTGTLIVRRSADVPQWVKWVHHVSGLLHCPECLMLDGCWFQFEKAPMWPHHEKCHCTLEPIDYFVVIMNATAKSDFSKFDPYLFNTTGFYSHGKEKLFAQWGYTVDDASWLRSEMERQAREKYILGDYELGKLNIFGHRINIMIEIPRRDQTGTVSFTSGWMVRPNGELKLSTPYGGK